MRGIIKLCPFTLFVIYIGTSIACGFARFKGYVFIPSNITTLSNGFIISVVVLTILCLTSLVLGRRMKTASACFLPPSAMLLIAVMYIACEIEKKDIVNIGAVCLISSVIISFVCGKKGHTRRTASTVTITLIVFFGAAYYFLNNIVGTSNDEILLKINSPTNKYEAIIYASHENDDTKTIIKVRKKIKDINAFVGTFEYRKEKTIYEGAFQGNAEIKWIDTTIIKISDKEYIVTN